MSWQGVRLVVDAESFPPRRLISVAGFWALDASTRLARTAPAKDGLGMDSFLIRGGTRLKGKVEISGSKNSALPILAATLMAEGKTVLKSVPRLSDIDSMVKLLGELGCHVFRH